MSDINKTVEWTLPVVDSDSTFKEKPLLPDKSVKLSNAAWTSVAIGVVTKKILSLL